jgi:hypothetical protein
MLKIHRDTSNELHMPMPRLHEQIGIDADMNAETSKLEMLIAKVESAMDRLQECRTALITAAVIGKIDVRKETHA